MNHSLNVKPVNRYKMKLGEGKEFREVDFGTILENLQEEYLDSYSLTLISLVGISTIDACATGLSS